MKVDIVSMATIEVDTTRTIVTIAAAVTTATMSIIHWLNKPYPFVTSLKKKLLTSLLFGLFIYIFLLVFQPFGLENIISSKVVYILGFGVITTSVMLVCFIVLPFLFVKIFNPEKWNVGKEILFVILNIILITIFNYGYNSTVGFGFAQQHGILFFILITLSVGIFPVTLLIFVMELYLNKKHQKTALEISSKIKNERLVNLSVPDSTINIITESKNEHFEIVVADLLFVKSEDNYCQVYYKNQNKIASKLLRISLKSIEYQFELHNNIKRCHRSYIVNKKQIFRITGNARAYYLHFDNCNEIVPISRNFKKNDLISI